MQLNYLFYLGLLAGIAYTSPVPTEATLESRDREYQEKQDLFNQAEKTFPGIYWETAYKTCTLDQLNDLYITASSVSTVLGKVISEGLFDGDLGDSVAWSKFFMPGTTWKGQHPEEYNSMINIYGKTVSFMGSGREGWDEKRKKKQTNRLSFFCGDVVDWHKCQNRGEHGLQAYTPDLSPPDARSKIENCPNCWAVGFCDGFFRKPKLKDVVKDNWPESELDNKALVSKEHAMFHEFMHVDMIGAKEWHVTDLKNVEIKQKDGTMRKEDVVYGAYTCSDYASSLASEDKVNFDVRKNADNYAWVMSYAYLAAHLGWSV